MANPLATARQLWRLNKDGKLALVEGGTPIPVVVADAAIKACAGVVVDDGALIQACDAACEGVCDGTTEALEA